MNCVIQRVKSASVHVKGKEIASIDNGIVALVGLAKNYDFKEHGEYISRKLLNLKLWPDKEGKFWKHNVHQLNYSILLVSNFTLCGTVKKGSKPDYHKAMNPTTAKIKYTEFFNHVKNEYIKLGGTNKIVDGEFGAYMDVNINNDGPVTMIIEKGYN